MSQISSFFTFICVIFHISTYYIHNCYGILVEESLFTKTLSDCRLNLGQDVFYCLRTQLKQHRTINNGNFTNSHHLSYYGWLLSLPNLSPNSVIYNQEPLEADQSHLYENNYLDEPKFAPMFYKMNFNEYYDYIYQHTRSRLDKVTPRSRFRLLKDKLNDFFGLPKFVIEAISSHTTSFSEIFRVEMVGDQVVSEDLYSRSVLLFLDYHFFRPLVVKAFIVKFLNLSLDLYRLRFCYYSRLFARKFRRYRTLMANKEYLVKVTDLTKYFDIAKRKLYPFTPLPFGDDENANLELPLRFTTVHDEFYLLVQNILNGLKSKRCVDFVFDLLDSYAANLYKIKDLRTMPVLESFYLLEVTPRSFGYSFYNIFPPEERKRLINYKDSFLVSSHLSRLDSYHRVIQIANKFLISVPLMVTCIVLVFLYVVKLVKSEAF